MSREKLLINDSKSNNSEVMSNKQIEEMAKDLQECETIGNWTVDYKATAEKMTAKGYRKQKDAKWVDNHCTACGMTPIGEEIWAKCALTPPKFEWFMDYCFCCGASMRRDKTNE